MEEKTHSGNGVGATLFRGFKIFFGLLWIFVKSFFKGITVDLFRNMKMYYLKEKEDKVKKAPEEHKKKHKEAKEEKPEEEEKEEESDEEGKEEEGGEEEPEEDKEEEKEEEEQAEEEEPEEEPEELP